MPILDFGGLLKRPPKSKIGTFISLCCCHFWNIFKACLFLYFVEDGTASLARTCSWTWLAVLFGKRKQLGLPFSFSLLSHNHQLQWNTANMWQTAFKIQAETCMSYLPFTQGIHYFCMLYCIVFLRCDWEVMWKTLALCLIRGSKHLEIIKAQGLMLSSVSQCLEPLLKHSHWFLTYYMTNLYWQDSPSTGNNSQRVFSAKNQ